MEAFPNNFMSQQEMWDKWWQLEEEKNDLVLKLEHLSPHEGESLHKLVDEITAEQEKLGSLIKEFDIQVKTNKQI